MSFALMVPIPFPDHRYPLFYHDRKGDNITNLPEVIPLTTSSSEEGVRQIKYSDLMAFIMFPRQNSFLSVEVAQK